MFNSRIIFIKIPVVNILLRLFPYSFIISIINLFLRLFPNYQIIDLTQKLDNLVNLVDIGKITKDNSSSFSAIIKKYIEKLNVKNASVEWFANGCSAKNPLSSPLFDRILDYMSVINFLENNIENKVIILGATDGQKHAINYSINNNKRYYFFLFYLKSLYKKSRYYFKIKSYLKEIKINFIKEKYDIFENVDIAVFTYIDGTDRRLYDPYFGNLLDEIKKHRPELKSVYFGYVYTPIKNCINYLRKTEKHLWFPIFSFLNEDDISWLYNKAILELSNPKYDLDFLEEAGFYPNPILKEVILEDISFGYINNLIMYLVGCRIRESNSVKRLIYPFENKSLEKCLLLGLNGSIETIGYQHSSISPRHFSFLMGKQEIKVTPIPDKIITSGAVTKDWLINNGNFPGKKIIVGCSLRYKHNYIDKSNSFEAESAKLFLALSSSKEELYNGVRFLRELKYLNPRLILRLRTHINFPLNLLPSEMFNWVNKNIEIRQETSLNENFEWADITLYVSSTVAVESLMYGVPVIHLDIDKLNSDPLLSEVSNRWFASNIHDCNKVVTEIANLTIAEKNYLSKGAVSYINSYFKPQDNVSYKLFLN
jgi:hypothetical protein